MTVPLWVAVPVVGLTLVCAGIDLRTRKIPNAVTFPALILGLVGHLVFSGPVGALVALGSAALAGALLLPGWISGWMGAGDVKLMMAVAAWLGFPGSVFAVLGALVSGGLISVVVALRKKVLLRSIRGAASLLAPRPEPGGGAGRDAESPGGIRVPFALAVLAGSLFALWRPV